MIFNCKKWFEESNHWKMFPCPSLFLSFFPSFLITVDFTSPLNLSYRVPQHNHFFLLSFFMKKRSHQLRTFFFCCVVESTDWSLFVRRQKTSVIWSIPFLIILTSPFLYIYPHFYMYHLMIVLMVGILISFPALPNVHFLVSGNQAH